MASSYLQLSDVTRAFEELGGEADWLDVEARVIVNRGNGFSPYKDWHNYRTTMFQVVQQHCEGYQKFKGDVFFVKVRDARFRLASFPPTVPKHQQLSPENIHPETVLGENVYVVGAVRQVLINAYERDPEARKKCIQYHGTSCAVCGLNFEERYGSIGRGFIHVHHRKPLATREIYQLDPIKDLVPVCPNCHSMLHSSDPPLSIEQLKALVIQKCS